MAIFADEQTWSSWDHITGEAFEGPLQGHRLDSWPVQITTVQAARKEYPDLLVLVSSYRSVLSWIFYKVMGNRISGRGFIPPGFGRTMSSPPDPRLGKLVQGLGVLRDEMARFYPISDLLDGPIHDPIDDRVLIVERRELDGVPHARWQDGGEPPMQLLSRWYGFSFTWPDCTIFGQEPA